MDDADTVRRKIKRAVTDSQGQVSYSDEQPGVKNLLDIYCACTNKDTDDAVKEFENCGYGQLKEAVGEAIISRLDPLQKEVERLSKDKGYIDDVIKENTDKARYYSTKTLRKVQKKVGFPVQIR